MRDGVRFLLGNRLRELGAVDPTMTVLDYLRRVERRCGTKEGCAEGDCGACTVVLGELDGDGLSYRPVNACIQFVPTLDGKQLITVEDLATGDGDLHPVQQAMVEAAQRMYDPVPFDQFDACHAETVEALRRLQDGEGASVGLAGRRFFAPRRLAELAELYQQHPSACLLAGGTDVGLWVTKQHRTLDPVIYVGNVAELRRLAVENGEIAIGAAVTYDRLLPLLGEHWPDF